jgi:predicted dehydrogenase
MAGRPIRALVIGAGETSTLMHLPALERLRQQGRLDLAEICDVRRDRAEAARFRFGFERTSGDGLAAIRRSDIDAVWLFGDAQLHLDYGMAALRQGRHLFVEKPIAPCFADACSLAEAAAGRALIAAGGHNRRFYSRSRKSGGGAARRAGAMAKRSSTSPQPPARRRSARAPG